VTITAPTLDDGTIGCCPSVPPTGMPTVLLVLTVGNACLRGRLTAESAQRLGKALSEAGAYIDPMSERWHDREAEIAEQL
jgi:hypothetical protein